MQGRYLFPPIGRVGLAPAAAVSLVPAARDAAAPLRAWRSRALLVVPPGLRSASSGCASMRSAAARPRSPCAFVGLALLLVRGLARGSSLVYTLGVAPQRAAAALPPGRPRLPGPARRFRRPARLERVGLLSRVRRPRRLRQAELEVSVRGRGGAPARPRALRRATAARRRRARHRRLRRRRVGELTCTCPLAGYFENRGDGAVAPLGQRRRRLAVRPRRRSTAPPDRGSTSRSRSSAPTSARCWRSPPEMAEGRASLFRARWLSPAAYALLAALLVLVAVPVAAPRSRAAARPRRTPSFDALDPVPGPAAQLCRGVLRRDGHERARPPSARARCRRSGR